jgi:uncharacterized protein
MKPGEHPAFYRLPAPPGRSRESTIVLDASGQFHHDGARVEHPGMQQAFARWIRRHPDDGRFILSNDYDWCYFTVVATPFFVTRVRGDSASIELFDGTTEELDGSQLYLDRDDVLRTSVKDGTFEARFTRSAQLAIAPFLADDALAVVIAGRRYPIRPHSS